MICADSTLFDQKLRRDFCSVSDVPYGASEAYLVHARMAYHDELGENGDAVPESWMQYGLYSDLRLEQLTICVPMNVIAMGKDRGV